jgi:hypothetical protein
MKNEKSENIIIIHIFFIFRIFNSIKTFIYKIEIKQYRYINIINNS